MSEKDQDFCTDCSETRRSFLGKVTRLGVVAAAAGFLGLGGKRLFDDGGWRTATTQERLDWIEERRNDPHYLEDQPELRAQILRGEFDNLELYDTSKNVAAAVAVDTCYVTTQYCLNYYCAPNARRCQREYRCWSASGGYWYNKAIQFGCPSCPCPRIT